MVLTGFEKDEYGLVSHFYYHETESTDRENGKHRKCSKDIFIEYFRGKAIFISKNR